MGIRGSFQVFSYCREEIIQWLEGIAEVEKTAAWVLAGQTYSFIREVGRYSTFFLKQLRSSLKLENSAQLKESPLNLIRQNCKFGM